MGQSLLDPRQTLDGFSHEVDTPSVEEETANPNKDIFDDDIFLLAIFRFECPIIIDEAVDDSPDDGPDSRCIYIIYME